MDKYQCNVCGKSHNVFKAIESPKPEKVLEIPDAELEQRVKEIQNSFILDDEVFFLRGDIFIYKENIDQAFFNWSVWASIALEDFKSKAEALKQRKNVEFNGELETQLPFYEKTRGLKVKVIVNINYDYAVIKVEEESKIKTDQSKPVSEERIIEIMQMMYHHPDRIDK